MAITVAELMAELKHMPPDAQVFADFEPPLEFTAILGVSGPETEDDGSKTVVLEAG